MVRVECEPNPRSAVIDNANGGVQVHVQVEVNVNVDVMS
jgi:hypothetical protein